ncbi:MAG TPA: hypothetical protein VFE33_14935 [Thermoanaerobaculia bacterium]|jgi:hypothetical protein|nr:hypothetical protein [Thermoanaerobaculia bacterium]
MATVKAAAKTGRRQATTAPAKPAAKVVRKARKPAVAKHIAPPYSADEIRKVLGITERDIQEARRLLRETDEELRREHKPAAAKLSD